MKWLVAIIIFGFLILFHEFGHFIVARLNGVAVEEFSIGFGPRIISAVKGGTRFSLKIVPFGGSCIMKGMITEDPSAPDDDTGNVFAAWSSGPKDRDEDEDSFNSKTVLQRMAIVLAGPFFNVLLAFICAVVLISVLGYDPPYVTNIAEDSPAYTSGLKEGDRILSLNGKHIDIERDVDAYTVFHELDPSSDIEVTVLRDGEKTDISFKPYVIEKYMMGITYYKDSDEAEITEVVNDSPASEAGLQAGDVVIAVNGTPIKGGADLADYMDNVEVTEDDIDLVIRRGSREKTVVIYPRIMTNVYTGFYCYAPREKTSATGILKYSFVEVRFWIEGVVQSLKMLFTGRTGIENLSGPVGIVNIVSDTYEESVQYGALMTFMSMLYLIVLLSANVGIMNLLPFPALDGGRFIFLIVEMITGRPVNEKAEAIVNFIGFLLIMILMVLVLYNDIGRII